MRTYGTVTKGATYWSLEVEPQVAMKLKRVFPKISQYAARVLRLTITPENGLELDWFMQRYPLEMDTKTETSVAQNKKEYETKAEKVLQVLSGKLVLKVDREPIREPRPYQQTAADLAYTTGSLMLTDELGLGKGQCPETPLLTPDGWSTYGEIKVGDYVVGSDGKKTKVMGVFPKPVQQLYKVTFSDKTSTVTDGDHLWSVQNSIRRNSATMSDNSIVLSTHEMFSKAEKTCTVASGTNYKMEREYRFNAFYLTGNGTSKWSIPMVKAVEYTKQIKALRLDPYLLGLLLGDGGMSHKTVGFTTADDELIEAVSEMLPTGVHVKAGSKYCYRLSVNGSNKRNPLISVLRDMGLMGNNSDTKFIPGEFMLASTESRLAMLQGLMDSEGTNGPDGVGSIFTSTSLVMAEQFAELARSLGGVARMTEKQKYFRHKGIKKKNLPSWDVNIKLPPSLCPFRLERKARKFVAPTKHLPRRRIRNIEKCGMGETICISVDAKNSLYVTENFLVTHNTFSALLLFSHGDTLPGLIVCPANLTSQWVGEINKSFDGLESHVLQKRVPYDVIAEENKLRKRAAKRNKTVFVELTRQPDILITSYHKLSGWIDYLSDNVKTVIFDEVQELRRTESQKHRSACLLTQTTSWAMGLTGTPLANHGGEVHHLMSGLSGGEGHNPLGNWNEFMREHLYATYSSKPKLKDPEGLALHMRDMGVLLRRKRDEVGLSLEEPLRPVIPIEADLNIMKEHTVAAKELAEQIISTDLASKDRFRVHSEFSMQLRQATALAKAPGAAAVADMLLSNDVDNLVIFAYHRGVYDILCERLAKYNPLLYTGSENPKQKQENLQKFLDGESRVLLISWKSSAGLDGLQEACSTGLVAEYPWTPLEMEQGLGRLDRFGQKKVVSWVTVTTDVGIDPLMTEVLGVKTHMLDSFNNPEEEKALFSSNDAADDLIRRLAADYLKQ